MEKRAQACLPKEKNSDSKKGIITTCSWKPSSHSNYILQIKMLFGFTLSFRDNPFLNEFEINAVDVQKALPKMIPAMIHLWK
jgi:hypothetical protein